MSWRTKAKHLSRTVAKRRFNRLYDIYTAHNLNYLYTTPIHFV